MSDRYGASDLGSVLGDHGCRPQSPTAHYTSWYGGQLRPKASCCRMIRELPEWVNSRGWQIVLTRLTGLLHSSDTGTRMLLLGLARAADCVGHRRVLPHSDHVIVVGMELDPCCRCSSFVTSPASAPPTWWRDYRADTPRGGQRTHRPPHRDRAGDLRSVPP